METTENNIHIIYKHTLIATLILCLMVAAGSVCFVYFVHPIPVNAGNNSVKQADHGTLEASMKSGEMGTPGAAADSGQGTGASGGDMEGAPSSKVGNELRLDGSASDSDYIWIPIREGAASADIIIENHYMDRQLWVSVEGGDRAFYDDNPISGNLSAITEAEAVDTDTGIVLKFTMDRVYEFNTIFENGVLYVDSLLPGEVYDRRIILDPAGFIPDEMIVDNSLTPARICLDIAERLKAKLEENDIKVYMTSVDERIVDPEECLALSSEIRPDMYIRIETAYDADTSVYGTSTVYNGTYFIPGFGSVELADLLEAYVTTSIGGKALGLTEAADTDAVIQGATVPAAAVRAGYYTNAQENILLNREDYRTRIADGIYNAVLQAYGE